MTQTWVRHSKNKKVPTDGIIVWTTEEINIALSPQCQIPNNFDINYHYIRYKLGLCKTLPKKKRNIKKGILSIYLLKIKKI